VDVNKVEWTGDGANIMASEHLEALKRVLQESFVIVEHRFFYGSRAPHVAVFDDYDRLETYLRESARPGDAIWCWRYDELCRDDNSLIHGKVPDAEGRTPRGGAY
jgi:hypothetical protein